MALYFLSTVLFGILYVGISIGYSDTDKNKKCEDQFQVCLKSNNVFAEALTTDLEFGVTF